jgi:hypothetical protein
VAHGGYCTPEPTGWERYLAELVQDKIVIVGLEVLASMTRKVADLQRWGAQRPILVAVGTGTGPVPDQTEADVVVLPEHPARSITEDARNRMAEPRLPHEVVQLIESRDPTGDALWWLSPVNLNESILDRSVIGGRSRAQAALEDKMLADAIWDAAEVARTPTRIVPANPHELAQATAQIRRQTGAEHVVWSGDARDGINGGADYVRWITSQQIADQAARFFNAVCDQVRVMPFLEGVPCSIHGMVLDDGVVVLRPVELVILRDRAKGRFFVGGLGTLWDPPDACREDMRESARRVGDLLQRTYEYRGGFGIDGVMTCDGFRPTEINPRFSGGLTRLARTVPDLQLELLQLNLSAGRSAAIAASGYEKVAVEMLDEQRFVDAVGMESTTDAPDTTQSLPVTLERGALRVASGREQPTGEILNGPSTMGRVVRLIAAPNSIHVPRCAEITQQVLALSDAHWRTRFGALEMAPDVTNRMSD